MRYLGIDQSLTGTGVCLVEEDGRFVVMSTVDTDDLRGAPRLAYIRDTLTSMVRMFGPVGHAALEGYSMGSINRPFDLGEVGGIVRIVLTDAGVRFNVVPPTVLKLFATGHGHSPKEKMISAAEAEGVCPKDNNQADAYFLARMARAVAVGHVDKRCEMDAIYTITASPKRRATKRRRQVTRTL